ncbi:hypothetical protein C5167_034302 [Papaver somniferum]|uniref:Pentacotripeptide-repeat region of PRORP domain-containing protein n=1 Tax=Papaver somniferum TaxID=3469 RepID=A0A4Y7KCL5_PAPSO|nr:hypothetical protein C5167_034302 [Papaver somniferum]
MIIHFRETFYSKSHPLFFSAHLIENVLGRLFSGHSNGLKAYEFFKFSLRHSESFKPTSDSFEKTLHILTGMKYFDKSWELMEDMQLKYPQLLTLKSMSIFLSRFAKFQSFDETLEAFERLEKRVFVGRIFGVEEFNVLLKAFCLQRQMKEAKAVFRKMHSRFAPNTQTLNILLLGFKETGNVNAVELFYHEMIKRGFKPTYNIRIDAYCKKRSLGDAVRVFEEMEKLGELPTIETITTLIHGAGILRDIHKARELFDGILDFNSAVKLMDEMEEKGIGYDNVTYHTVFSGFVKSNCIHDVCKLYRRMVDKQFVPKSCTVVMLMKYFCENQRVELGMELWDHLVMNGTCPHGQAVDHLVTSLCSCGEVDTAHECLKQLVERGRHPNEGGYRVLERFLVDAGKRDKLMELEKVIKKLQTVLPPSKGDALIANTN